MLTAKNEPARAKTGRFPAAAGCLLPRYARTRIALKHFSPPAFKRLRFQRVRQAKMPFMLQAVFPDTTAKPSAVPERAVWEDGNRRGLKT